MVSSVLFVSVRNAGRTQMATAWFNALVHPGKARAVSAGIDPAGGVLPEVLHAMREVGLELSDATPRLLTPLLESTADVVITIAPTLPDPPIHGACEHDAWVIDDPEGETEERVRKILDDVEKLVRRLLVARQWMPFGASSPPTAV
jgi:arsenate reductase